MDEPCTSLTLVSQNFLHENLSSIWFQHSLDIQLSSFKDPDHTRGSCPLSLYIVIHLYWKETFLIFFINVHAVSSTVARPRIAWRHLKLPLGHGVMSEMWCSYWKTSKGSCTGLQIITILWSTLLNTKLTVVLMEKLLKEEYEVWVLANMAVHDGHGYEIRPK